MSEEEETSSLPEGWDDLASSLGLAMEGGDLVGTIEGRSVRASHQFDRGILRAQAIARIEPSLDLGLDVHRVAVTLSLPGAVELGSPDLDDEFRITGDEPGRVAAFFTDELRGRLVSLNRASYDLGITDDHCRIFAEQQVVDAGWMRSALLAAVGLVGLVEDARARLQPAEPLVAHGRALAAFAAARSLAYRAAPLALHGVVEAMPVSVWSWRTGRGRHAIAARAHLEVDLGIGLSVKRAGLLDGLRTAFGGQDVTIGDAPFDKRFLVRVEPGNERRAAALLSPDVRAALLEIDARAGGVEVDDRRVTAAGGVAWTPETVTWLVDALASVASRIAQNLLHGGEERGPYR